MRTQTVLCLWLSPHRVAVRSLLQALKTFLLLLTLQPYLLFLDLSPCVCFTLYYNLFPESLIMSIHVSYLRPALTLLHPTSPHSSPLLSQVIPTHHYLLALITTYTWFCASVYRSHDWAPAPFFLPDKMKTYCEVMMFVLRQWLQCNYIFK